MYKDFIQFVQTLYGADGIIPLHEPRFDKRDKDYVNDAIESTFVSSVGEYVDRFEKTFADYIGSEKAVATTNGTAALHTALLLAGVNNEDEVLTQALAFVATCNAIAYCNASPVFIDVSKKTLGLCPQELQAFISKYCRMENGNCVNIITGKIIRACVPVHTFGHACEIDEIVKICEAHGIVVIEDAAEALGSRYNGQALGTFGHFGCFSFNGNKIITTGGGGMIVCRDSELSVKAKHITTTAKLPHKWEFYHDCLGYNYRMPNLNAALGCAQLEKIAHYLASKREISDAYEAFFENHEFEFIKEPENANSNYWLNTILTTDKPSRDEFLQVTNDAGVQTRPVWKLMNILPMYKDCQCGGLKNSIELSDRLVNIPSSVKP